MKPVIFFMTLIVVSIIPARADEFDAILSDISKNRAAITEFLSGWTEMLDRTKQLEAVCTASEKRSIIEPFMKDMVYLKEFSNTIISSIDEYVKLCTSVLAYGNNADRNSLIHIYEMYKATYLYYGKQGYEISRYHDIDKIVNLAVRYGIPF